MPEHFSILVKPASSACNLNCAYCFYKDEASHRECGFRGMMSPGTAENIIKKAARFSSGSVSVLFQGGEPLLAGLDFFRRFVMLEKKYSADNGPVFINSVQTNGVLINSEWAEFFKENGFFAGLSLDGPASIHNRHRLSENGEGSFSPAMRAAGILKKHGVEFSILSVVTNRTCADIEKTYKFLTSNGFHNLQFIPCLAPLNKEKGPGYAMSGEQYKTFIKKLAGLYYGDRRRGKNVSVRYFDNLEAMKNGCEPEACGMCGHCSIQFVCESNGDVYPCDFYCTDEYLLGNINETDFDGLFHTRAAVDFIKQSLPVPEECRTCALYPLCRNGCRRERKILPDGTFGKTEYCMKMK